MPRRGTLETSHQRVWIEEHGLEAVATTLLGDSAPSRGAPAGPNPTNTSVGWVALTPSYCGSRVNARLEEAALTTAPCLGEVSRHWDAVYDAMRRADRIDHQISFDRDNAAARAHRSE
jgi:hypothetical protein